MARDTAIDDPSSVDHFMEWAKSWTSRAKSPSPAPADATIQEDAKLSVAEAEVEIEAEAEASSQKQEDGELKSLAPVISVAHKAAKPSTTPASKLASVDKLDDPLEPDPEPVEKKKGNGLMDSDHAPSKTKMRRSGVAYEHNQERLPGAPQSISPVPFEVEHVGHVGRRVQHDVMEYFDTKRKEYYGDAAKTVLQSKDSNAPLKSPKKTKPNPLAKEYAMKEMADMDETLGEADAPKADQQEQVVEKAEDSDAMDLTPMLNVLGARTIKVAETAASQEIEEDTNGEVARMLMVKEPAEQETIGEVTPTLVMEPAVEEQHKTGEVTRSLVVKNLPEDSDYTLVQSVIQGATIMSMKFSQDKKYAQVKVTDLDDCRRIVESGKNGVEINHKGRKHTVLIETSSEDPAGEDDGLLDIYLDCGATRAVQAEDVNMDLTMRILCELASGPAAASREVEDIIDSLNGGARKVVFRFTSIQDAVAFRASLRRKSDWKDKNVKFVRDPCA